MSSDTKSALSHAFLAASSGWALSQCMDLPFAAVGFGLYLVNGVLGVACYVMKNNSSGLRRIQYRVYKASHILGLPLIATEFYLFAGLPQEYCWAHLVFPVYHIIDEEILDNIVDNSLIDLNSLVQILSASYSSFVKDKNIYGFGFAFIQLIACFGVTNVKVNEFCFLAGLGSIAALFMLKGPQF